MNNFSGIKQVNLSKKWKLGCKPVMNVTIIFNDGSKKFLSCIEYLSIPDFRKEYLDNQKNIKIVRTKY